MGKYQRLWQYVNEQFKNNNLSSLIMSFDGIHNCLGFKLNHSFLTHKKELLAYGYELEKISIKEKNVSFKVHN